MKANTIISICCFFIFNAMFSNVIVLNGLTHVYTGKSGDVISGEIILVNSSNEEQRVTFELSDAIFSCTESRRFSNDATHPQSSRDWFKGNLVDKLINPKEKYVYRFTIEIPNDTSLKGSYWNMLMVNVEQPIKEELLDKNIGLDTKIRYAIGLMTHVDNHGEMDLDFESIAIRKNSTTQSKEMEIKLFNFTSFIEAVRLSIEVYDGEGNVVFEDSTDRYLTFPKLCKDFKIDVTSLPAGEYECVLIADARDEFVGTNFKLQLE